MTIDPANLDSSSLVSRVRAILLQPQQAWDEIAREPVERDVLRSYAVPLAAFSALCVAIGLVFFKWGAGGFLSQLNPVQALISGAFHFATLLIFVVALARVLDALAPSFGAAKNPENALRLSVYASTAAMVSGVFALHPSLGIFGVLGLYSFVLLFIGLPRLMPGDADKRGPYFAAAAGVSIGIMLAVSLVLGAVRGPLVGMTAAVMAPIGQPTRGEAEGAQELAVPGGSIDLRALEQQARNYTRARTGIDPARLQSFLPATLPSGFARGELSSSATPGVSQASANYTNGDARMTVTITRMESGAPADALAGAANVQTNRRDANGFSRVETIDGRVYSEQVNEANRTASYAVVGRGLVLSAEGTGVTSDQLRAAVETIGIQRIERAFGG